jgi:hypothetical protein
VKSGKAYFEGNSWSSVPDGKAVFYLAENWYSFSSPKEKETVNFTRLVVSEEFFAKILPLFVDKNIVVELVDDSGNPLSVGKNATPTPYFDAYYAYGVLDRLDRNRGVKHTMILAFPALYLDQQLPLEEYQHQVYVDIAPEELEKMSEVLVRYEPVQSK